MDVVCDKFCCDGSILEDNTEVVIGTCAEECFKVLSPLECLLFINMELQCYNQQQ